MVLKLYNTLTGKKEALQKKPGDALSMYVCGITPYDNVHLGHARCYVTFDVLRRYLAYKGFSVKYIQNFTDIDDKIIARAHERKESTHALAERNIAEYLKRMDELNVSRADSHPRVTEHIPEIIQLIKKLIDKKHAYRAGNDVYFDIKSFPSYGKLSRRNLDELKQGARVEIDEKKNDPLDFTLWKEKKENEPAWDSPWGEGRPGWHIECSMLSMLFLGETIDIHGGGQDLIFPHHENEIAQSEAATGKPFVRMWIHNGFVTLNQQKMSKSLGNFFTLEDIFKKYDPMVVRLFLLSQHYRSPLDFSDTKLEEVKRSYQHLQDTFKRISSFTSSGRARAPGSERDKRIDSFETNFITCMDDDINTAGALAHVFNMVTFLNEQAAEKKPDNSLIASGSAKVQELLKNVLGITIKTAQTDIEQTSRINQLIAEREEARRKKDYKKSDQIRAGIMDMGIMIEDTPSGTRWWVKNEEKTINK